MNILHPFTTDSIVTLDDCHGDARVPAGALLDSVEAEMAEAFGWGREMPDDELGQYLDGAYQQWMDEQRNARHLNEVQTKWLPRFRREYVAVMPEAVLVDWVTLGDERMADGYGLPLVIVQEEAVAELMFRSGGAVAA